MGQLTHGFAIWRTIAVALSLSVGVASAQNEHPHHHPMPLDTYISILEDPKRDEWQKPEVVIQALKVQPGHYVADIGAGSGYFTRHIARAVGETGVVFAVDVEE